MTAGVIIAKLRLQAADGKLISENLYWSGAQSSSYRQLNHLPPAVLQATATLARSADMLHIHVRLVNRGNAVALQSKLTSLTRRAAQESCLHISATITYP
jgi:hypothetical protein